ncbi:MAG: 2-dehydro-3-deoxy-6-phosphogalactonate aldolase [Rhodospirillaceae bacterium]|nr:2-dehydro-3-deoxy-6-phosphogalactonate aldolase [Rhodospirillaceae bacterium]
MTGRLVADVVSPLPLVAILRGLVPERAEAVGDVLVEAGFRIIEVPLNSPRPFDSIDCLARRFGPEIRVGAGTVRDAGSVRRLAEAGGTLVVMPHSDPNVIAAAKSHGMLCMPGVATPTEAFAALDAGADALKLFPAEALPPPVVKAWRAVLPQDLALLPVGGITPGAMAAYMAAGASGFGLGSALFKPGIDDATLAANARAFVDAFREIPN